MSVRMGGPAWRHRCATARRNCPPVETAQQRQRDNNSQRLLRALRPDHKAVGFSSPRMFASCSITMRCDQPSERSKCRPDPGCRTLREADGIVAALKLRDVPQLLAHEGYLHADLQ